MSAKEYLEDFRTVYSKVPVRFNHTSIICVPHEFSNNVFFLQITMGLLEMEIDEYIHVTYARTSIKGSRTFQNGRVCSLEVGLIEKV